MKRYRVFKLIIASMLLCSISLAYEKPAWVEDQWWDINSAIQLHFNGEIPGEMTVNEDNIRYHVKGQEWRALETGQQDQYFVYVIEFEGLTHGSGFFHINHPFPLDVPMRLKDTTISGELLIVVESLSLMSWRWQFDGILESRIGFDYTDVGELAANWTLEYDPPRNLYAFPLNVGESWSDNHLVNWYGDYSIVIDMTSQPLTENREFSENGMRNYAAISTGIDEIDGLDSIDIAFMQESVLIEEIWYSWIAEWNTRMEMVATLSEGPFYVSSWTVDLDEFGTTAATPQPTRTPVPPTQTPTPLPPTIPPPTPTGTLPTPTSTYTLPPWIPKTPTPEPGTPTSTPSPPEDRISIRLHSNFPVYGPNDYLLLTSTITNPLGGAFVMQYVILQYSEDFWFWPGWTREIDGQFRILPADSQFIDEKILEFTWPDVQIPIDGITFWAILTLPDSYQIIGDFGQVTISYLPESS